MNRHSVELTTEICVAGSVWRIRLAPVVMALFVYASGLSGCGSSGSTSDGTGMPDASGGPGGAMAADTTPAAFSLVDRADVPVSSEITSAPLTISGINAPAPISVMGGAYSIGCTVSFTTAAATIQNEQTVCVQHTSAATLGTATDTTLTVGGVSDTFTSTTEATPDTTPVAFTFTDLAGVPPNTVVTSNTVTITGINSPTPISVSGGSYRIDDGAFGTAASTVRNNQRVQVRHTSGNGLVTTAANTTLTVGSVSDTFTTTAAVLNQADSTPTSFLFNDVTGVRKSSTQTSNVITVGGINVSVPISVTSGSYSIGCTSNFTEASGTINNGERVCVRHTSASTQTTATNTQLTVGGVSDTFTSTTAADGGTGGPGTSCTDGFTGQARVFEGLLCGDDRQNASVAPLRYSYFRHDQPNESVAEVQTILNRDITVTTTTSRPTVANCGSGFNTRFAFEGETTVSYISTRHTAANVDESEARLMARLGELAWYQARRALLFPSEVPVSPKLILCMDEKSAGTEGTLGQNAVTHAFVWTTGNEEELRDVLSVYTHEMVHMIESRLIESPIQNFQAFQSVSPPWAQEGLAQYVAQQSKLFTQAEIDAFYTQLGIPGTNPHPHNVAIARNEQEAAANQHYYPMFGAMVHLLLDEEGYDNGISTHLAVLREIGRLRRASSCTVGGAADCFTVAFNNTTVKGLPGEADITLASFYNKYRPDLNTRFGNNDIAMSFTGKTIGGGIYRPLGSDTPTLYDPDSPNGSSLPINVFGLSAGQYQVLVATDDEMICSATITLAKPTGVVPSFTPSTIALSSSNCEADNDD